MISNNALKYLSIVKVSGVKKGMSSRVRVSFDDGSSDEKGCTLSQLSLQNLHAYTCMYACACAHLMHVDVGMKAHPCGHQPWVLFLVRCPPCISRLVLSLGTGTHRWSKAGWSVSPRVLPVTASLQTHAWSPAFSVGWGLNSGPLVCTMSTFLTALVGETLPLAYPSPPLDSWSVAIQQQLKKWVGVSILISDIVGIKLKVVSIQMGHRSSSHMTRGSIYHNC